VSAVPGSTALSFLVLHRAEFAGDELSVWALVQDRPQRGGRQATGLRLGEIVQTAGL